MSEIVPFGKYRCRATDEGQQARFGRIQATPTVLVSSTNSPPLVLPRPSPRAIFKASGFTMQSVAEIEAAP
jgi:hypothetical protein